MDTSRMQHGLSNKHYFDVHVHFLPCFVATRKLARQPAEAGQELNQRRSKNSPAMSKATACETQTLSSPDRIPIERSITDSWMQNRKGLIQVWPSKPADC